MNTLYRTPAESLGPVKDKNKRSKRYTLLLIVTKVLLTLSFFVCYELIKSVNFVIVLFYIKLCSSIFFTLIHKPISNGKNLTKKEYQHVALYSLISVILTLLWMEGLIICGPVRSTLLMQHSDIAIIVMLNLIFNNDGNIIASASRGAGFFTFGLFCLFLFDQDKHGEHHGEENSAISSHVLHHFGEVFTWLGLPDHKGGILLLLFLCLCRVFVNNYAKKISIDIDGSKRLKALSSCFETIYLLPLYFTVLWLQPADSPSIWSYGSEFGSIFIIIFILDFYVESISVTHLRKYLTHRWGSVICFLATVAIGFVWEHWNDVHIKHKISLGVIFAAMFFVAATRLLVQPPPIHPPHGKLIGYSTSGTPIYNYVTIDGFVPRSLFVKLRQYMRIILEAPDSRNIFFYLCLNLIFTGVELLYGMWTNSLGLISDGFHMLFDCSALVLGLWASIASKWSPTKSFSFGYGRIEVLSGFVNGLFLIVIACAVFATSVQRIYDPPQVNTEKLLVVSVAGLLVNILGITVFSHAHSHGGKSCDHGHSHENHGHSHEKHDHTHEEHGHTHDSQEKHGHSHSNNIHSHNNDSAHSHSEKKKDKQTSANMQGVFLHVLADTLGSVGVIFSTLLIQYYEWYIADPLCSLCISFLIFLSVLPLLKDSAMVLLQRTPQDIETEIVDALYKVKNTEGVLSYREVHIWQHTSEQKAASIIVQVDNNISEHKVRQKVMSTLKDCGIAKLTVQVEKLTFHEHMSKLTTGYYSNVNFPEYSFLHNISTNDVTIRVKEI